MDPLTIYAALEQGAVLPPRHHPGDAGIDLAAAAGVTIAPGDLVDIPTGVRLALPRSIWVLLTGRSSTFRRHRLLVLDGVIDSGYRGELFISAYNLSHAPMRVRRGQRLAQIIPHHNITGDYPVEPLPRAEFDRLPHDGRGDSGFGSTG